MARCQAKTRDGDQCRNKAMRGTKYCYIASHGANAKPFYRRCLNFLANHVFLTVIGLILAVVPFLWRYRDLRLAATSGVIAHSQPALEQTISIGAARLLIDASNGDFYRDENTPILSVALSGKKLFVSAEIRNENVDLVAELKDNNEWALNKNEDYDRNYNDQSLEVRDNPGDVVLQVVDFGDTINLAGVFRCSRNSEGN